MTREPDDALGRLALWADENDWWLNLDRYTTDAGDKKYIAEVAKDGTEHSRFGSTLHEAAAALLDALAAASVFEPDARQRIEAASVEGVVVPVGVLADLGNAALGIATHHADPSARLVECFGIARSAIEKVMGQSAPARSASEGADA